MGDEQMEGGVSARGVSTVDLSVVHLEHVIQLHSMRPMRLVNIGCFIYTQDEVGHPPVKEGG